MGFMDKFKTFMGLPDDEYYEDDDYADEYDSSIAKLDVDENEFTLGRGYRSEPAKEAIRAPEPPAVTRRETREPRDGRDAKAQPDPKVVNIHTTSQVQVVLVKPERFEDVGAIADHLNAKRTVVLNLEAAERDVAKRLIDFLSGVAYANDGQIKRVANCTYIITPYNVGVLGDLRIDELESSGFHF